MNAGKPFRQADPSGGRYEARRKAALSLLSETLRSFGWRALPLLVFILFCGGISLLPAALFRYFALQLPSATASPAHVFLVNLALFGSLIALAFLLSAFGNAIAREWIGVKVEERLRGHVLSQIHRLPLDVLDGAQRGEWLTSMTKDMFYAELFFMESLPGQIREASIVVGAAALFFRFGGAFALVLLATAGALIYLNFRLQKRLGPYLHELRALHGDIFQTLIESLEGIRTIRSHRSEAYIERRFHERLSDAYVKTMRVGRHIGSLNGMTELGTKLLVVVCLCGAAWLYTLGKLTLREAFIYPFFTGMFYDAAKRLAERLYDWNRFFNQAGTVAELIYHPATANHSAMPSPPRMNADSVASLKLQGLSLGYSPGKALVAPFDFQIRRGVSWAVMGPSGSGKSTFLEVVAGLRSALEVGAEVLDGRADRLWGTTEASSLLPPELSAYVEQHPYLFEASVRENLLLGSEGRIGDDVLYESLDAVGLKALFLSRDGLETRLVDRGKNLSAGERYRLALCRALLLDRPFLLLDEPFAALDEDSIRKVVECLNRRRSKNGILLVSHFIPEGLRLDGVLSFQGRRVTGSLLPIKKASAPSASAELGMLTV